MFGSNLSLSPNSSLSGARTLRPRLIKWRRFEWRNNLPSQRPNDTLNIPRPRAGWGRAGAGRERVNKSLSRQTGSLQARARTPQPPSPGARLREAVGQFATACFHLPPPPPPPPTRLVCSGIYCPTLSARPARRAWPAACCSSSIRHDDWRSASAASQPADLRAGRAGGRAISHAGARRAGDMRTGRAGPAWAGREATCENE